LVRNQRLELAAEGIVPQSYVICWGASIDKVLLLHLLTLLAHVRDQVQIYPVTQVEVHDVLLLGCSQPIDSTKARLALLQLGCDIAVVDHVPDLNQPGLMVMDMDSTTIQIECIDEIAKLAGVGKQVSDVTLAAMQGKLNFAQSLRSRVALLRDAPESILQQVAKSMPLTPGVELLIATLKAAHWKVIIASGGFTYFARRLQTILGLDAVFANEMVITDGLVTGEVAGDVVDARGKAEVLCRQSQLAGIPRAQTIAIGDGANDLKMMDAAGLGIAFHAKPLVREQAQMAICHSDLDGLVCVLKAGLQRFENWGRINGDSNASEAADTIDRGVIRSDAPSAACECHDRVRFALGAWYSAP
jgi:phosphoserine phosphatase